MSGRVRELHALRAERQRSALGELRVALVLGDAGLGKSRLAAELLPHDDELAVGLIARASPFGGIPSLLPWSEALDLHADGLNADRVCRACGSGLGGIPALAPRAGTSHDPSSCVEALRHHFVEWLPGLLAKASAERPIVIVLDDVHQGHDAVWEMLLRLTWDSPASRLFVLATARPADLARNRMAVEVLHVLEQNAMVRRIALSPLSRDSVRELAGRVLRRDSAPSALVDWLMTRAQGNPRCTVGLLEALIDSGADIQAPTLGGVPGKLARWVRTELVRLDPPALALVELLAVVGDLTDPGVLAQIIGQPLEDIALTLERLVSSGMVVEEQGEGSLGYRLAHPLTREVLCTGIGGARRRVMHRLVAGTLLESGRTEAAASHFVHAAQAGDGEAIDALSQRPGWGNVDHTGRDVSGIAAARRAGDLHGEELAARQLLAEAQRAGDQRGIAEALRTLGYTLGWQGRFEAAENVLMRGVQVATAAAPGFAVPTPDLPTPDLPTPDLLTRRERQVAELAACGYTASQIATRLHIGVRTVESHLARSYPKLGITSKQQLVQRAAEFGFTPGP